MNNKKEYQAKFHAFACEVLEGKDREMEMYRSVIGVVHTLLEEDRLEDLNEVLELYFKEYYPGQPIQNFLRTLF